MPIYEYECRSCGERTEVMQKISDPPLETCESCGGELKKLISPPAFQFKGTGWYVTDYARKDRGKRDEGKSEGASSPAKSDSGSSAKSDAKASSSKSSD